MDEYKFELLIDGLPYLVKVIPFEFNAETRYRVSYNGGKENIFAWDSENEQMRAIDHDASTLPDSLEVAIGQQIANRRL